MYVSRSPAVFGVAVSCSRSRSGQFIYHLPVIRANDKSFTYVEGIFIHSSPSL